MRDFGGAEAVTVFRPDVRVDRARELGQAVLWHRVLVTGDDITPELIEHIVDAILIPYVRPTPDHQPPPTDARRVRSAGRLR